MTLCKKFAALWAVTALISAMSLAPTGVASAPSVTVHAGRLSAELNGESLRVVLAALARSAPITVAIAPDVPDTRVQLALKDVPLADGIQQLLRMHSYALEVYHADKLRYRLWVLHNNSDSTAAASSAPSQVLAPKTEQASALELESTPLDASFELGDDYEATMEEAW